MARAAVRTRRKPAATTPPPPRDGWWGKGPAPWERWPGVTIRIEAVKRNGRWESPDEKYFYDASAADLKAGFFPDFLTHHKGEFAAQPFTLLPYQDLLIVRPLFGWKHAAGSLAGLRRFRKVFVAVPKGNGKSPLGAGLGIVLTFYDDEEGAEVYSAAADRDQAAIVFDTARIMVESDPVLAERSNVLRRVIEVPETRSYYKVLSADAKTKHGPNIHGLIFDEFHAQTSRELYETLQRGMVKRRQPVLFMITTAGDDDESICYEEWDYARKVQSGTIPDESYLPVIFEGSKEDDWQDPKVWKRVNPGFGITVKADAVANEALAAKHEPRKLNDFLRYHLNRWVNQATAWIPVDWWDACKSTFDESSLVGLQCFAGLDMSQKYDLTAFVLVFPEPLEGSPQVVELPPQEGAEVPRTISLNYRLTVVPYFWLPGDTLKERVEQDRIPYDQWRDAGLLRVTQGGLIDYDQILKDIATEIAPRFPMLKQGNIGYDPAYATDIASKLRDRHGFNVEEVPQTFLHMSEPSLIFEALVKRGRVRQSGHRLMRHHVENVEIKTDYHGRIRPVKTRRHTRRVDGVVASVMAIDQFLRYEEQPTYDVFFVGVK